MTYLNPEDLKEFPRYRVALQPIADLYFWGLNYEFDSSPWAIFLDLIGYSEEILGVMCFDTKKGFSSLGYLELDYLADALKVVAQIGLDAYEFVSFIDEAAALDAYEETTKKEA